MAKTIVGHIEAFEFAKTGVFDHSASVTEVVEGDMVLCRNTAPLVKLCLEFLHQGKKAYVKGADIGEELVRLVVRSGKKTNAELVMWLEYELKKISNQLKKRFTSYEDKQVAEHNSYVLFAEKQTLLTTIITSEGFLYTKDLIVKIRQIFMDVYSSGVCLSTVHKAKGLECDRVFILDKEKTMPSRYAKLPWQRLQEKNLEYVAYTRAKDYLGFIIDWTFFPDKK
jgi:DNA helicase-2/ATP-dependent DNA helicase PcrA